MTESASSPSISDSRLISHSMSDPLTDSALREAAAARIRAAGDLPGASVDRQLALLDALAQTELGRFLLRHRGLDAAWTQRLVSHEPGSAASVALTGIEKDLYERLPATCATRERYGIFRRELQALLRSGATLASVPCGLMGDLLSLDYRQYDDVSLIGIDLDAAALAQVKALTSEREPNPRVTLACEDAWALSLDGRADVLTSNGLNIYEPDDARVTDLYRSFLRALKPGGTLVTSFLTPPPTLSAESPWNMERVDPAALALQFVLFVRIVDVRWSAFRTHEQTRRQLEEAGFAEIRFVDDAARMFPTVIAKRPG